MLVLCFIGLLFFITTAFILYKISKKQKNKDKAFILALASIIILSIGLELSLFNINFYNTKSFKETSLNTYLESYKTESGVFLIPSDEKIEFSEINEEINNIRIDLNSENRSKITVEMLLTDEANKYYFSTPERDIYPSVTKSEYININTAGKSNNLLIHFTDDTETTVNSISINAPRPFDFSLLRVLLVIALLVFIYIFLPSSPLYKIKLSECKELKTSLLAGFVFLQCFIIIFLGIINPTFMGIASESYNAYKWDGSGIDFVPLGMENHNQYDELAQAFLNGKAYIDNDDVPEFLKNMENPYDTTARAYEAGASGESYRWDVAYYNGHYYVYFGIVPLLLMYLPFRAIMDAPFPSAVGIMIFALIFSVGVFKLLEEFCKKKFRNVSAGTFLITAITFVNCCGMTFLAKRPDFYSVPIMTSMAFIIWGILMWVKALNTEKRRKLLFFAGSLFMALSVGCRPQSVLICLVALPLFRKYFFKDKYILNKKGIKDLIVLAVPFIAVASVIMVYNYIRFGSPFDFGSSYNLTTNDVTRRGFEIGRTSLGLFTYLFQPPQFTATFPYIQSVDINTNYMGKTITENCFGGLITSLPMLWFIFALPKAKKLLKGKNLFSFVCTLIFIGVSLVIADTQAGGLLQRYYSDFGYIFFLGAVLIIFALCEQNTDKNNAKSLNNLIKISAFLSIFYSIALAFSVSDVTIESQNPTLFATILHLIEFWL